MHSSRLTGTRGSEKESGLITVNTSLGEDVENENDPELEEELDDALEEELEEEELGGGRPYGE